jgi:hypothetical protein
MDGMSWMYGSDLPLLSLTFARGITARELLDRMDAVPATVAVRDKEQFDRDFGAMLFDDDDSFVVSAGKYGDWAWAWEHDSWRNIEAPGLLPRVSEGTAAMVLHANEKPMVIFRYAEAGELVVGINTLLSLRTKDRTGSNPQFLDTQLFALGADPEEDEDGPLGPRGLFYRLVEGFGAGLPLADLMENPRLSGRLRP